MSHEYPRVTVFDPVNDVLLIQLSDSEPKPTLVGCGERVPPELLAQWIQSRLRPVLLARWIESGLRPRC